MKTLRMMKIMAFSLIIMAAVSFVVVSSTYASFHAPSLSPSGDPSGGSGTTMPPSEGNGAVQQAQQAASTATQAPAQAPAPDPTPSPSKIDPAVIAPAATTTTAATPGVQTKALATALSSTLKPLKVSIADTPLSDTFYGNKITGMDTADNKSNLKGEPLKETISIKPDATPAPVTSTPNDKEKPNTEDMALKPMADDDNLSKENMEPTDNLKVAMKDLKELETFTESSQTKETNDKLSQIADMINSDKANMKLVYENNDMGGVFKELRDQEKSLMRKYEKSTEPYYDIVRNILAKNITVIQVAGMMKQITEEDVKKMPRNEIDKIIEKLRQAKDNSFAKEYVLQEEAKCREKYINPNAKKIAGEMAKMLDDFTKQVSGAIK